ncbi:MAG TPA: hypothetical protein VNS58_21800 [Puia sp.]|nr:hypothetical protein [Puia sp.]
MKNPFIIPAGKSGFPGKLIPAILFLLVAATTQAQSVSATTLPKEDSSLVKYLGTQDDLILFNVAYKNPQGAPFSLVVKDQDGTELYKNAWSEKNFSRQFRLPKADRSRITFIIRNGKEAAIVKTFEINVNSRYVQDIAVKKLN